MKPLKHKNLAEERLEQGQFQPQTPKDQANADRLMQVRRQDLFWAHFGLGRFIDYRFKHGAPTNIMIQSMDSYLTLEGVLSGLPPLELDRLQVPVTADTPDRIRSLLQVLPFWLPDSIELQQSRQRSRNTNHCMFCHREDEQ